MANETIPDLTAGTPPYAAGTLVELAVPDGLGGFVSRKGLLPDLTGAIPLASGTITDPVAYFDLALPAGYVAFRLQLFGLFMSTQNRLVAAFSDDAGATFFCDTVNFDTYTFVVTYANSGDGSQQAGAFGFDSVMRLSPQGTHYNANLGLSADLIIRPGSEAEFASVFGTIAFSQGLGACAVGQANATFNTEAVEPPVPGAMDLIRLLPWGNSDVDPPTSGITVTAGAYALWGVPA